MTELPPGNMQETLQQNEDTPPSQCSSEGEVDFDPDDSNQKFFNLADVKPLDFKAKWLGNTNEVISKFQTKLSELHKQKINIKQEFIRFAQNENRFKISSLRQINIGLNKKELYNQYMKNTRRTIEKLHPSLILNICSYVSESVFLALARLRRVSKIFNIIFNNENVIEFFSEKDFGISNMPLTKQEQWCERYISFKETFLYYKEIKYTVLIPQNSIKEDIEKAVDFINEVYKRTFALKSINFGYFQLVNRFMKHHRIVLALQALTFTDMAVTKKASIVAFSNYLAFTSSARQKEEITKTKYLKMIQMIEDEHYRDSLVINSKISNFLQDQYNYQFSVFIDTLKTTSEIISTGPPVYDLVVYHMHNELKSSFSKGVVLSENALEIGEVTVEFIQNEFYCVLNYRLGNRLQAETIGRQYLPTFVKGDRFGDCYIYRGEFYYILLIKSPEQSEANDE